MNEDYIYLLDEGSDRSAPRKYFIKDHDEAKAFARLFDVDWKDVDGGYIVEFN